MARKETHVYLHWRNDNKGSIGARKIIQVGNVLLNFLSENFDKSENKLHQI